MAEGLQTFAFNATSEEVKAVVLARLTEAYTEQNGAPSAFVQPVLQNNAEAISLIAVEELAKLKNEGLPVSSNATDISQQLAERIEARLRAEKSTNTAIATAVDGFMGVGGMGDAYFTQVAESIGKELATNLTVHNAELAALMPPPKTEPAPAADPAPVDPATPAPGTMTGAADLIAPPAAAAELPAEFRPAAENGGASPASSPEITTTPPAAEAPAPAPTPPVAEAPAPAPTPPAAETPAPAPTPPAAEAPAPAPTPPIAEAPAPAPTPPVAEAPAPAPTPTPAATPLPESLSAIFAGGAGQLAAFANEEQLKGMIRSGITKMGADPADYSDADVTGMAQALQESGAAWLTQHQGELSGGNLSEARISALSSELATGVRSRMTEERVGKFARSADGMGMVDTLSLITGVDEDGALTRPYQMNIYGMAQAALTSAAGDEEAKRKYQERLAYEESYRAFHANEEGVTPELARDTARQRAQQGNYGQPTQDIVAGMAENAFEPSMMDWFSKLMFYISQIFSALFSGSTSKIGELMANWQDGTLSATQQEHASQTKNFSLYQRILNTEKPEELGYNGPMEQFNEWRLKLATDVTGIHYDAGRNTYVDINPADGSSQGLSAVSQGLDANGFSRIPGQEAVRGVRHGTPGVSYDQPIITPPATPAESPAPASEHGSLNIDGVTLPHEQAALQTPPEHGLPGNLRPQPRQISG